MLPVVLDDEDIDEMKIEPINAFCKQRRRLVDVRVDVDHFERSELFQFGFGEWPFHYSGFKSLRMTLGHRINGHEYELKKRKSHKFLHQKIPLPVRSWSYAG